MGPLGSTARAILIAAAVVLLHAAPDAAQAPARGTAPRIAPVDLARATEEQRAILSGSTPARRPGDSAPTRRAGDVDDGDDPGTGTNELRTYAHHPVLAANLVPFARYIAAGSTLTPRHRALLIMRTAWLCRSAYTWAHHAKAARRAAPNGAGLDSDDLARIARGPGAAGWQPFEATLLRVADELHVNAFVSDPTWQALTREYDTQRAMDAVFTVAEITMTAGTVNTLRIAPDDDAPDRLPLAIPYQLDVRPTTDRLIGKSARITPLEPAEWTPEVRAWLDRANTGRPIAGIYRTYARHLAMDKPRTLVSEHIRQASTLSGRIRELLILRIGWLCRSEYEWAAHAPAGRRAGLTSADLARIVAAPATADGATRDADTDTQLLRAVDELHRDDAIGDATWTALAMQFDTRQLLDILTTVGGYRMVSMALNTFGVQLEPGAERFPD